MVGWKGRLNVDLLVCHCRSLWRARQSILSMLCRYGVDGVDGGGLPADYYVLDPVWSRLWAPLATEGQVQRLYKLGMAYCNYLMLSCHLSEFASGHFSRPKSVRLNAARIGP